MLKRKGPPTARETEWCAQERERREIYASAKAHSTNMIYIIFTSHRFIAAPPHIVATPTTILNPGSMTSISHLLWWSLQKKGCLRASRAVSLSVGSYLSNPCNRCMRSPAEWSTFCIIKFCKNFWGWTAQLVNMTIAQSVIKKSVSFYDYLIVQTWRRGSFITALILSLEVAPSGQSNLPFLTYFSACRLKRPIGRKTIST